MAILVLDGWAGRERIPCEVIGETPKRYRIKLQQDALLPSRRACKAGDVVLVPKYAVVDSKQSGATSGDNSEDR